MALPLSTDDNRVQGRIGTFVWATFQPDFVITCVIMSGCPEMARLDGGLDERFEGNNCRQLGRRHSP